MRLEIEIDRVANLSERWRGVLDSVYLREFGSDPLIYADVEWYVMGLLGGNLIGQVGILQRVISVNRRQTGVAGMCRVVTEPDYRRRGVASRLVRRSVSFMKNELGIPFGLLTCKPRLEAFYIGLGWKTVKGPTTFDQPDGVRSCGGLTMVVECGQIPWPEGPINFCGLPW